jgi:hypothetical protein
MAAGFILSKDLTYTWPVPLEVPADGGGFETKEPMITFKHMGSAWIMDAIKKIEDENQEFTNGDLLRDVIVGWSNVKDIDSKELPFNPENLEMLLDFRGFAVAAVDVFFSSLAGKKQTTSPTPPVTGTEPAE